MEDIIHDCPACGAVLLGGEESCPACRHVINPDELPQPPKIPDVSLSGSPEEMQCPRCHESLPVGLVRCRECGAFLHPGMEAALKQKLLELESVREKAVAALRAPRPDEPELPPEDEPSSTNGSHPAAADLGEASSHNSGSGLAISDEPSEPLLRGSGAGTAESLAPLPTDTDPSSSAEEDFVLAEELLLDVPLNHADAPHPAPQAGGIASTAPLFEGAPPAPQLPPSPTPQVGANDWQTLSQHLPADLAPLPTAADTATPEAIPDFEFDQAPLADLQPLAEAEDAGEDEEDIEFFVAESTPFVAGDGAFEGLESDEDGEASPTEAAGSSPGESRAGSSAEAATAGAASAATAGTEDTAPAAAAGTSASPGDDLLLQIALEEEAESARRAAMGITGATSRDRKSDAAGDDTGEAGQSESRSGKAGGPKVLVYCPNGHKILVQERHRGRKGKCPQCEAPFFVPLPQGLKKKKKSPPLQPAATAGEGAALEQPANLEEEFRTPYARWIEDVHLHRVNLSKLKLKTDSLLHDYDTVDLGFRLENFLIATVYPGGGAFRGMQEPKKKPLNRKAMFEHLAADKPPQELPLPRIQEVSCDQWGQIKVVQPSVPGEESLFADVAVFGVGRIAIRIPAPEDSQEKRFLSFSLTQFRKFCLAAADIHGISHFAVDTDIPLYDQCNEVTCHYTDTPLQRLTKLEYYRVDPEVSLELLGHMCQGCGLVVSEAARRKEKIGGNNPKSVARATCPKCKQKFGDVPIYGKKPPGSSPT